MILNCYPLRHHLSIFTSHIREVISYNVRSGTGHHCNHSPIASAWKLYVPDVDNIFTRLSPSSLSMNSEKMHNGTSSHASESSSLIEPPPPFTSHFFDKTEAAAKARLIYYKVILFRTVIIVIALFAIFSIYWGALFEIPARSLQGWIVVCGSLSLIVRFI